VAEEEKTEIYSMMDDVKWIEERGKRKGIGEAKNKKKEDITIPTILLHK